MEPIYRIAVLGYGSVPNQPRKLEVVQTHGKRPDGNRLNADSVFVRAEGLMLPVRLGRHSGAETDQRRITMVIDKKGYELEVLYALSSFSNLERALINLAKREGCGESTKLMGFVDLTKNSYKSRIPEMVDRIKKWAAGNNFSAVIWADFPEKDFPVGQEKLILEKDALLLKNTKEYIASLALPLSPMEETILKM